MASRIEKGFIPLDKIEGTSPVDNIEVSLNLPDYVDQAKIGINLGRISRLCSISGISSVKIIGKDDQEQEEAPEVVGINSDGSAIASKKIVKVSSSAFDFDSRNRLGGYADDQRICNRQQDVIVRVNIGRIASEATGSKEGIRSARSWVKELDKEIRCPLKAAGLQNLTSDQSSRDIELLNNQINTLLVGSTFSSLLLLLDSPLHSVSFLGFWLGIEGLLKYVEAHVNKNSYYRFSLSFGPQYDRALMLKALSSLPLVGNIGNAKQSLNTGNQQ